MSVFLDANSDGYSRSLTSFNATAVTWLLWVKFSNVAVNGYILSMNLGSGFYDLYVGNTSGRVGFYANTGGGVDGSTAVSNGVWYHIAATVITGANNAKVYINAVLESQQTPIAFGTDNGPITIGHAPDSSSAVMQVASFKFYQAVLTPDEIANEMRQMLPRRTANLFAFYPFLSTAGATVDFSGNGNTLTSAGTPTDADGPPIPWMMGRRRVYLPPSGPQVVLSGTAVGGITEGDLVAGGKVITMTITGDTVIPN